MENIDLFQRMGLAIAIGATVGVERHWREKDEEDGARTAGIRTYTLIGMLGGTAGMIEQRLAQSGAMPGLVIVGFLVTLTAAFALFQFREEVAEKTYSATSVVVAMLTFALGAVAVLGDLTVASAGGVVLVAILASREFLHEAVRKLQWAELRSAVILLALTFVVLPIVPSEPIGPFGGVSPSRILVLVIVLAAISFCGYIAVRLFGDTVGEVVAGAIGGVVSSTAMTITNARRSAVEEKMVGPLAAGAASAGGVSLLRTGLLVFVLAPPVAPMLIGPLLAGAAAMLAYALVLARHSAVQHQKRPVKNPFDLDAVVKMALVLVGVAFLARAASAIWGDGGLYVASALAGLADVDAVAVTVAGMLPALPHLTASMAIGFAVLSNMLAKAAYSSIFGSRAFATHLWAASVIAVAAAILCQLLIAAL
jgi:uncharacterized membrane protein (DUF4010 family)